MGGFFDEGRALHFREIKRMIEHDSKITTSDPALPTRQLEPRSQASDDQAVTSKSLPSISQHTPAELNHESTPGSNGAAETSDQVSSGPSSPPTPLNCKNNEPGSVVSEIRQTNPQPNETTQAEAETISPMLRKLLLITEAEIADKSKGNNVAKLLTVLQTTWFILQYIERWAAHQTRTQLELMTLAYAILNILIYSLWWNKPLNVNEPFEIADSTKPKAPTRDIGLWSSNLHSSYFEDAFAPLLSHLNNFGDDNHLAIIPVTFVVVGSIFGGMHCFAWDFHFPSRAEEVLWRVSAIYCTIAPLGMFILAVLMFGDFSDCGVLISVLATMLGSLVFIVSLGYIVCRAILLVLTFTCLRAEPASIFKATVWTKFLPHIS